MQAGNKIGGGGSGGGGEAGVRVWRRWRTRGKDGCVRRVSTGGRGVRVGWLGRIVCHKWCGTSGTYVFRKTAVIKAARASFPTFCINT